MNPSSLSFLAPLALRKLEFTIITIITITNHLSYCLCPSFGSPISTVSSPFSTLLSTPLVHVSFVFGSFLLHRSLIASISGYFHTTIVSLLFPSSLEACLPRLSALLHVRHLPRPASPRRLQSHALCSILSDRPSLSRSTHHPGQYRRLHLSYRLKSMLGSSKPST